MSLTGIPILFIPKKDRSLCLYVDYKGINKITIKNRYPLSLIEELLECLFRAKYFSKIDLKDIYYRIRIKEADR